MDWRRRRSLATKQAARRYHIVCGSSKRARRSWSYWLQTGTHLSRTSWLYHHAGIHYVFKLQRAYLQHRRPGLQLTLLEVPRQARYIQQVDPMTQVPIPENYGSIEQLANWLSLKMPHEEHWGHAERWQIIAGRRDHSWHITFQNPSDASLFNLMWPRWPIIQSVVYYGYDDTRKRKHI